MLDGIQLDGELTLHIGPATYSRLSSGPLYDIYYYGDCRVSILNDKGTAAVYSPSPPNPLTPATFTDGDLFLAGWSCLDLEIWHDRRFGSFTLLATFCIDKGSHQGELVTPEIETIWSIRPTTEDGYHFAFDNATVRGTCGQQPEAVELTSWGRIKANYR